MTLSVCDSISINVKKNCNAQIAIMKVIFLIQITVVCKSRSSGREFCIINIEMYKREKLTCTRINVASCAMKERKKQTLYGIGEEE